MASIRNLKTFVIYQTNELIDDCKLTLWFNPKADEEKIVDIMIKGVELRNELFDMINNPTDKHDRKSLKKYYKQVLAKMYAEIDELFEELSSIFKS